MSCRRSSGSRFRNCACAAVLMGLMIAGETHAGAIYKCVDAQGAIAFQDNPCAVRAAETEMPMRSQPLIDPAMPMARAVHADHARPRKSREDLRGRGVHRRRGAHATSWECRAADGEVFYRHTHCPHSVPGDGVMRSGGTYALSHHGHGQRGGRDAWSPVTVHARKVPRSEACRQINAVAAVERDGSARDEHVSVYDHVRGRDPCTGY